MATVQMSWFHLQRVPVGEEVLIACSCPHERSRACFHQRYLESEQGRERFPVTRVFGDEGRRAQPILD